MKNKKIRIIAVFVWAKPAGQESRDPVTTSLGLPNIFEPATLS